MSNHVSVGAKPPACLAQLFHTFDLQKLHGYLVSRDKGRAAAVQRVWQSVAKCGEGVHGQLKARKKMNIGGVGGGEGRQIHSGIGPCEVGQRWSECGKV